MIPSFQLSRVSLIWLLVSQALLVAPHLPRLPIWIVFAWAITLLWRVQIFRGVWRYPNNWIKAFILGLNLVGLFSHYGRFYGLEPMVALLISAFILKLLEMHTKREALLIIYLGYFVAASQLLFHQSFVSTVYILLTLICVTSTLLTVYQAPERVTIKRTLGVAGSLLLQSLPLMLLLFIAMPRIGSLWAVPQPSHSAKTGVSDTMSPGDFSNLVKDESMAFRVRFDGAIPPNNQLYWRGLVFSYFDGREWSRGADSSFTPSNMVDWNPSRSSTWQNSITVSGEPLRYEVILEASQQPWLYAIPAAISSTERVGVARDNRLVRRMPVRSRFAYEVESYLNYTSHSDELSNYLQRESLRLPEGYNPRSLAIAAQWFQEEQQHPQRYMQRLLDYFNQQFIYTLQPPLLGEHSVDEFMWDAQRGFCEHFASSFVFMMRAAGIPARVVVGYQGGKINPLENFLLVTQADAHAWSEVWLQGRGWVRVDPTAAVAPNRIERGLDAALDVREVDLLSDPFSLSRYQHIQLLYALQYRLEAFEYNWHTWVMGYDQENQRETLKNLLGEITPMRLAIFLLSVGGVSIGVVALWLTLTNRQPRRAPAERYYRQFLKRLAKYGVVRRKGEGPRSLAKRVAQEHPDLAGWSDRVTSCYETIAYGQQVAHEAELKKLINK